MHPIPNFEGPLGPDALRHYDLLPAGVCLLRPDGRFISANRAYCESLGHPLHVLTTMRVAEVTHPEDRARDNDALADLLAAGPGRCGPAEIELRCLRADGSAAWCRVTRTVVHRGAEAPVVLAVLFDIGRRKRIEEALHAADRKKDEFLAMLAHELRNPLAPIGSAAALLRSGRLDPARTAHVSEVISRQVQHMTGLVNDLLDVSRVTRGIATLEQTRLDARRIVTDAVDQVRPLIEQRRHALHVDLAPGPMPLVGDPKRLVQVLVNLLNNAAKFTREGGRIQLAMEVENGRLRWTVADNGIGMAPDLVERAFELFAQAERTADRSQGGLGIGLALVRSLVELHGGTVTASSAGPGRGSEFTVRLPLAPAEEPAPDGGTRGTPERPERGLRLMVVDDNVDAATLLGMLLEELGHEVIVEHDSQRALQRAVLARPDVFLLDIGLPEIDGNELARRLRRLPETRDAVLVAVTGYGQDRDREQTAAAGFDHHFMKPVDPQQLAGVLSAVEERLLAAA